MKKIEIGGMDINEIYELINHYHLEINEQKNLASAMIIATLCDIATALEKITKVVKNANED